jgi:dethiobiotin synthetase
MSGLFVTGTDTGIGKTHACVGLMRALRVAGRTVAGMKPVATGSAAGSDGARNPDALALQAAASLELPYADVNPYAFLPPIAPHVAALRAGAAIRPEPLAAAYGRLAARADVVIVEGIGGWRVPLGPAFDLHHLVRTLDLPVLLVVGLRLGCISHARLTAEAIRSDGCRLCGWVANAIDPAYEESEATVETLGVYLDAPLCARLEWRTPAEEGWRNSPCIERLMAPPETG